MRFDNDPNERKCTACKQHFVPLSVSAPGGPHDGHPFIPPPVDYICMSCRAKDIE